MHTAREAVLVAQDLFLRLGAAGAETVVAHADCARDCGDAETAQFWTRVARAMTLMAAAPSTVRHHAPANPREGRAGLWGLMQRIEGFRHLASEAERHAGAQAGKDGAEHLLSIASGCRQLSADLEQTAEPQLALQ